MREEQTIKQRRPKRTARIRAIVVGTRQRPRLQLFRSNQYLYAQLIDDDAHKTLSSWKADGKKKDAASHLGTKIAEAAKKKGISAMVFDRGGYKYHGAVQAVKEAIVQGGITV